MATNRPLLFPSSSPTTSVRVHALVVFGICDSYVRRPEGASRVIGTLLGSVLPDGTVDVRNCYTVPHNEGTETVALDIDYHHNMYASHRRVNSAEVIVGWFSTGFGVSERSVLIHEFYSREVQNPIHLTVDTGFTNGEPTIKAYTAINLSLGDKPLAAHFQGIPVDLEMVEAERVGFELLKVPVADKIPNDLDGMEVTMERLYSLIDEVYKYVDDVVEGRVASDNKIGKSIAAAVAVMPKLSPDAFDKLFHNRVQDNLALVYLASITRTQLRIAEKLNTAAQIL